MSIIIKNLTKKYKNGVTALNQLNLEIPGGIFGLLGENGAGKTTFMRMICGILAPTGGSISFDGMEAATEGYRSVLGYLPQDFGYYPDFTGKDFLLYMAALKGLPKRRAGEKAKELIEMTALKEAAGNEAYAAAIAHALEAKNLPVTEKNVKDCYNEINMYVDFTNSV